MPIYEGTSDYMKRLVLEGIENLKKERKRWAEDFSSEGLPKIPGLYGKQCLKSFRGNTLRSLFIADDNHSPAHLYKEEGIDEAYRHAANMLANQVHELLMIPGVDVNLAENVSLEDAIDIITSLR